MRMLMNNRRYRAQKKDEHIYVGAKHNASKGKNDRQFGKKKTEHFYIIVLFYFILVEYSIFIIAIKYHILKCLICKVCISVQRFFGPQNK